MTNLIRDEVTSHQVAMVTKVTGSENVNNQQNRLSTSLLPVLVRCAQIRSINYSKNKPVKYREIWVNASFKFSDASYFNFKVDIPYICLLLSRSLISVGDTVKDHLQCLLWGHSNVPSGCVIHPGCSKIIDAHSGLDYFSYPRDKWARHEYVCNHAELQQPSIKV